MNGIHQTYSLYTFDNETAQLICRWVHIIFVDLINKLGMRC